MIHMNFSIAVSEQASMLLPPPLVFLGHILRFIINPLNHFANWALRRLGVEPRDEVNASYTVEEVQSIVAESQREGLLHDDSGLLRSEERRVGKECGGRGAGRRWMRKRAANREGLVT